MSVDEQSLLEACRAHGLRATPQRLWILRALRERHDHPGPEALHKDAQRDLPSLSLATVYKTLEALEAHGVIEEVTLRADSKRYDGNIAPHHHLVCVRCKKIEDLVDDTLCPPVPKRLAGFKVASARMQIMGICANCTNVTRGRRAPRKEKREWQS